MIRILGLIVFALGFILAPGLQENEREEYIDKEQQEFAVLDLMSDIYADSVLQTLSLDEKIAQLIMLDVYPNKNEAYYKSIDKWVREKKVGGIIFFRGEPAEIAKLSYRYTSQASIPIWVALDAEWGVSMRVDSIWQLPKAITLGAITDNFIIREYGMFVGQQCQRFGVNMNMSPVADVNNNPRNPVINYRSFGENPYNVAAKAVAYFLGLNDAGVVAVAKHFPGHGNTDADSHTELPLVNDNKQTIDSVHLHPFRELIKYGIPGIMSAHLFVPSLDNTLNLASSLSPRVLNKLLLKEMNFQGIVITDALGMQGVSDHFVPGQMEVKALLAGNDILLMPQNPQVAIDSIRSAVKTGKIPLSLIDEKCRKLLKFKYIYLTEIQKNNSFNNIPQELNNQDVTEFIYKVYSNALTLVQNNDTLLPFSVNSLNPVPVISIGRQTETVFFKNLKDASNVVHYTVSSNPPEIEINRTYSTVENADQIIVCLYGMNNSASKRYGINDAITRLISGLAKTHRIILVLFGNPYALNFIPVSEGIKSVVVAYEERDEAEYAAAMAVTGSIPFKGKLPVSCGKYKSGDGIITGYNIGLQTVDPSELNIDVSALDKIDSLIENAIQLHAMPGCQLVLAQHGKVFYKKSYGYHTYDSIQAVRNSDLYDLASLTKMLATTTAIMKLYGENKIVLTDQLQMYLSWLKGYPVGSATISQIMTHQSGMPSWIPFYKKLTESDSIRNIYFSNTYSEKYGIPVTENMFLLNSYADSIYIRIAEAPLLRKRYRYSDLGFMLLKLMVEEITGESFDQYLYKNFYKPMHLNSLVFLPLNTFNLDRIVPTEMDTVFRRQLIHGYVHDPGAAMLGGISGHAGLFGNAMDVAAMMQMFLDHGMYGGQRYLDSAVVEKFTAKQFPNNRRGLGFDKPALPRGKGNSSDQASGLSFGHTGFTGTFAWADPESGLVVVFLSNRVYPDAENRLLSTLDVRSRIQYFAYQSIQVH